MPSLILTEADLARLSEACRREIFALFDGKTEATGEAEDTGPKTSQQPPIEITGRWARSLLKACSADAATVIGYAVTQPEAGFALKDLEKSLGLPSRSLAKAWTEIERLGHAATDQTAAPVIAWSHNAQAGKTGRMASATRTAFRQILGVDRG
ncbi:MAG: hypothetical protein ACPGOY_05615 [Rhodospirillaceae bacterium]